MKYILITFLIIILAGAAIFILYPAKQHVLSDKDRAKAMAKLLGHEPVLSVNPKQDKWGIHQGKYFNIAYPLIARIYADQDYSASPSASFLEMFQFEEASPRYFFTIQVDTANNIKNYDDISGVRLRRIEKDIYTEKPLKIDRVSGLVFVKDGDDLEKTVFVLTHGKVYSLSLTGNNPKIMPVFDRVIGNFKIEN